MLLYKDYAFRGFSSCPDPFLEYQRSVNPLHQGEEQPTVSSGLQGPRNVGISKMNLDTEETRETHNL